MRNFVIFAAFVSALLLSCSKTDVECRIHGVVNNPNLEGKKIFLMALDSSIRDSVGVDSTVIEKGKFEFVTKNNMMGLIRLDWHFRVNTQELLVVEEPGDVHVVVDSISSGKGTPNNDALQKWKQMTEIYNKQYRQVNQFYMNAHRSGDSITANSCKENAERIRKEYRKSSLSLAEKLDDGPFKTFIIEKFPKSYKRRMPDGTITEVSLE